MLSLPTPTQELSHPLLDQKQIRLFVKRDDLIHPEVMGNKWRKLKYNLDALQTGDYTGLVTLGGAYSNHIAAVATLARECNIPTIGIIRGNELTEESNPTLSKAAKDGMKLVFTDRTNYRSFRENNQAILEKYPGYYFLPEGGTNELAIKGCREIVHEIPFIHDLLVTSVGTGGTMAGLVAESKAKVLGISSLKGAFVRKAFMKTLKNYHIARDNYAIDIDYHFGGYGKARPELIEFINWFKEKFDIPLEPIYTGKTFFGVWNMIKNNKFEKNIKIVLLHTGGLQGIKGFNRKCENIIQ